MKFKPKTKLAQWQERCKSGLEKCARCGETRHLTVDHIVPVNILNQISDDKDFTSFEMEQNFEILCRYCNTYKAGRIDVRDPKTYKILVDVLEKAKRYYIDKI